MLKINKEKQTVILITIVYCFGAILGEIEKLITISTQGDFFSNAGMSVYVTFLFKYMFIAAIISEFLKRKNWARIVLIVIGLLVSQNILLHTLLEKFFLSITDIEVYSVSLLKLVSALFYFSSSMALIISKDVNLLFRKNKTLSETNNHVPNEIVDK